MDQTMPMYSNVFIFFKFQSILPLISGALFGLVTKLFPAKRTVFLFGSFVWIIVWYKFRLANPPTDFHHP